MCYVPGHAGAISRGSVVVTYRSRLPEPWVRSPLPHPDPTGFLSALGWEDCVTIFCEKGGIWTTTTPTAMETILAGTSTLSTLVGEVFTLLTANPLLTLFLAASLIGLGLSLFRKLKRTAK